MGMTSQIIRVRFAPSPTGHVHLGGLRCAFYNYIFARQRDGKYILRIEDTDQTRTQPGSAEEIEETLDWAGLAPDESPLKGGPHGPYRQSERLELYKQRAQQLLAEGHAYRCFCSTERLALLKKHQLNNRERPRYDGRCRHLSKTAIEENLAASNGRHVLRFALQPGQVSFNDMVYGDIKRDFVPHFETDPVILKSDCFPTYHFANVVDDNAMKISHVLRGSEWLVSTPIHLQMYQAFKWPAPNYIHFPLLTMTDGSKMSKRHDHSQVKALRAAGFRPLPMLNFLTNVGGGVPKHKQDAMEFWDLNQFIKKFDFKDLTNNPARVDMGRLREYSMKELDQLIRESPTELLQSLEKLLVQNNIQSNLTNEELQSLITLFSGRLTTLNDLVSEEHRFLWKAPKLSWDKQAYVDVNLPNIVNDVIALVRETNSLDKSHLDSRLREIADSRGLAYKHTMRLLRKLLTNNESGLPVYEIFECLGKQRLLDYLNEGLKYVSN